MKFYFLGTIFNVEKSLKAKIEFLISNLSTKYDVEFFLVESDSADNTVSVLNDLQNSHACFSFVSLGRLKYRFPSRVQRIAYCRNKYIQWLREKAVSDDDKIFLVDLDQEFDVKCFVRTLHTAITQDLDVIFANSSWRYYDIFALRSVGWVNDSFNLEINRFLQRGTGSLAEARWQFLYSKMRRIRGLSPKIPVLSAFGACCMMQGYVFNRVNLLSYDVSQSSEDECEHISFNAHIIKAGFNLWILPSFVASGINKHNLNYYRAIISVKTQRVARYIWNFTKRL